MPIRSEKKSIILLIELLAVTVLLGIGAMMLSVLYTGTHRLAEKTKDIATANRVISNILEIADSCTSKDEWIDILKQKGEEISPNVFYIGYGENGEFINLYKDKYIKVITNVEDDSELLEINCIYINEYIEDSKLDILDISTKKYYGGTENAN